MNYSEALKKTYGGKVRVRVCGILEKNRLYLLVNHRQMNEQNTFWNFPGGGVDATESLTEALKREFLEEVNLEISIGSFLFLNEVVAEPLHAIELYFEVFGEDFNVSIGTDPELNILTDYQWMSLEQIQNLSFEHRPAFFSNLKLSNDLILEIQP
jgi:8-oxo-dGTP diphosphatase